MGRVRSDRNSCLEVCRVLHQLHVVLFDAARKTQPVEPVADLSASESQEASRRQPERRANGFGC